jgi:hypothetical protein
MAEVELDADSCPQHARFDIDWIDGYTGEDFEALARSAP